MKVLYLNALVNVSDFFLLFQDGPATVLTSVKKKVKNVGIFLKVGRRKAGGVGSLVP